MERLCSQIDPRVSGDVVPFVDQPANLAVQPVFSGEWGAISIVEAWKVEGLEAIAVAGIVSEPFLQEGGAIFECVCL